MKNTCYRYYSLLFVLVPFRAANKTDLSNELESAFKTAQPILTRKKPELTV